MSRVERAFVAMERNALAAKHFWAAGTSQLVKLFIPKPESVTPWENKDVSIDFKGGVFLPT